MFERALDHLADKDELGTGQDSHAHEGLCHVEWTGYATRSTGCRAAICSGLAAALTRMGSATEARGLPPAPHAGGHAPNPVRASGI